MNASKKSNCQTSSRLADGRTIDRLLAFAERIDTFHGRHGVAGDDCWTDDGSCCLSWRWRRRGRRRRKRRRRWGSDDKGEDVCLTERIQKWAGGFLCFCMRACALCLLAWWQFNVCSLQRFQYQTLNACECRQNPIRSNRIGVDMRNYVRIYTQASPDIWTFVKWLTNIENHTVVCSKYSKRRTHVRAVATKHCVEHNDFASNILMWTINRCFFIDAKVHYASCMYTSIQQNEGLACIVLTKPHTSILDTRYSCQFAEGSI